MRELTMVERELLARRRNAFDEIRAEMYPVLADFIERLGLRDAPFVVKRADAFLPAVDQWMAAQSVSSETFQWVRTRIAYFLGELLVQRMLGNWLVDERPDSPFFARIVVGGFERSANAGAVVDVFAAAATYLSAPPGRSLTEALTRIEGELLAQ